MIQMLQQCPQGYIVEWTNADSVAHTVTSSLKTLVKHLIQFNGCRCSLFIRYNRFAPLVNTNTFVLYIHGWFQH